jgi:hypothetical protein
VQRDLKIATFLIIIGFSLSIPQLAFGEKGTVTISWVILPAQTLSLYPNTDVGHVISHRFRLLLSMDEFSVYKGAIKLKVRSNIPWLLSVRTECEKEGTPTHGILMLVFGHRTYSLGCKNVPLITGPLGEHIFTLEFVIMVLSEMLAPREKLESTLLFEIFPWDSAE